MSAPSIVELQLKLNLQGLHYVTTLQSALKRVGGSEIRRLLDNQARSILGIEKAAQRAGKATGGFASIMGKVGMVGAGMWAVKRGFQAVGGAIEDALDPLMQFQHNMARVRVKGSLDAAQTAAVGDVVKGMTGKTLFKPTEASEAAVGLAAAGFATPEKMKQALPTTLRFAQSNDVSPEEATKILMGTMGQFHKGAGDLEHIGDLITKADTMSVLSVSQIFDTLKYVGPLAYQAKMPLEEVLAMVVSLGDAGINASKGGTGIRSLMSAVAAPTGSRRGSTADKQLKKIGMSRKDLVAGFSDIPALTARIDAGMKKAHFNPAESMQFRKVLFGQYGMTSQAALQGDSVLEKGQTQTKIQDIRGDLAHSAGQMARGADIMAQTMEGRAKVIGAKWELFKINLGERLLPDMEKILARVDAFANTLTGPGVVEGLSTILGGFTSALVACTPVLDVFGAALKGWADQVNELTGNKPKDPYSRPVTAEDDVNERNQFLYGAETRARSNGEDPMAARARAADEWEAREAKLKAANARGDARGARRAQAGKDADLLTGGNATVDINLKINDKGELKAIVDRISKGGGPNLRVGMSSAL
jgi:TP901 family phage tail tape measure protein